MGKKTPKKNLKTSVKLTEKLPPEFVRSIVLLVVLSLMKNLMELQATISKMPLNLLSSFVLPKLGLELREVLQHVRRMHLRMTMSSVASVLRAHIASTHQPDEVACLNANINIFAEASSSSTKWHAIWMKEPKREPEQVDVWCAQLRARIKHATRALLQTSVHTEKFGDLMIVRVRAPDSVLYVASAPAQHVAFTTRLGGTLLKACVQGLGFAKYEDMHLCGHDLMSLLRIADRTINFGVSQLTPRPNYEPRPHISKNCIDYTYQDYDSAYVADLIGPDPPLLTYLDITSSKRFHEPAVLDKSVTLSLVIKGDNIAETLKRLVAVKAIRPTSDLIKIFNQTKSNKIELDKPQWSQP